MRRGNELEPFARAAYEAETGVLVQTVGLALHDVYPFVGASMDGLTTQWQAIGKDARTLIGAAALDALKARASQAATVDADFTEVQS